MSDALTPAQLAEIRQRADAATPTHFTIRRLLGHIDSQSATIAALREKLRMSSETTSGGQVAIVRPQK